VVFLGEHSKMSATNFTPIQLYRSTTALAVPLAANLAAGELALNIVDGKLYYNDSGTVKLLASNASTTVVNTISFGTTGLTPSTATSGAVTVAGTLVVANGGTGLATIAAGRVLFGAGTSALGNSANLFWDSSNNRFGVNTATPAVTTALVGTDALLIPVGTTGQRPTGAAGYLRFNSTTGEFEGYNGTAWASVGGAALVNDTSTATNLYPLFATATSGTAATLNTSNAKLLYKPSTGEFQSSELVAGNGIFVNSKTVSASYTVPSGSNAMSAGPVTVADGITVTVSDGSVWTVI
jgi:hypothetical protein